MASLTTPHGWYLRSVVVGRREYIGMYSFGPRPSSDHARFTRGQP